MGIVDALGGVTIDAPKRIRDDNYPHEDGGRENVNIPAGEHHFDGHLALAYSRIRRYSGDFARMHRQRCVIGALIDQADPMDLLTTGFPDFLFAVRRHIETDIPLWALRDFATLFSRIDIDRVATLRITRYNYGTTGHAGQQLYDLEAIAADARVLIDDPTAHVDTQDGMGWESTCEQSFD